MNTSDKILTNFANSMYACMNIEYAFTTPRVHARMKNTNINGDENEQNGMNSWWGLVGEMRINECGILSCFFVYPSLIQPLWAQPLWFWKHWTKSIHFSLLSSISIFFDPEYGGKKLVLEWNETSSFIVLLTFYTFWLTCSFSISTPTVIDWLRMFHLKLMSHLDCIKQTKLHIGNWNGLCRMHCTWPFQRNIYDQHRFQYERNVLVKRITCTFFRIFHAHSCYEGFALKFEFDIGRPITNYCMIFNGSSMNRAYLQNAGKSVQSISSYIDNCSVAHSL